MRDIINHTTRPKYIVQTAKDFLQASVQNFNTTNFISIHWRYNQGDWTRHCEKIPDDETCNILEEKIFKDQEYSGNRILIEAIINFIKQFMKNRETSLNNFKDGSFFRPFYLFLSVPGFEAVFMVLMTK